MERRIIGASESRPPYPERIRANERISGASELAVSKLPDVVFVQVREDAIIVLNVVHTKRKLPG